MGWDVLMVVESAACAAVAMAAVGFALLAVGSSRDVAPSITDDERGDLAIW